jgi:hypothetical protein
VGLDACDAERPAGLYLGAPAGAGRLGGHATIY